MVYLLQTAEVEGVLLRIGPYDRSKYTTFHSLYLRPSPQICTLFQIGWSWMFSSCELYRLKWNTHELRATPLKSTFTHAVRWLSCQVRTTLFGLFWLFWIYSVQKNKIHGCSLSRLSRKYLLVQYSKMYSFKYP